MVRLLSIAQLLLVIGVTQAQFTQVDSNWTVVDVGGGTKPSFDFDANGALHVMGMTEARPGVVWYATATDINGPWEPQNLASGYFYGPGDIRVDHAGTAHIAWHHHDLQDAAHISIDGDEIQGLRVETPDTHDGWDNALAIAADGELRMASIDPSAFGATDSLVVSTLTDSGWTSTTVEGSQPVMYGLNSSIVIDTESRSHVAYSQSGDWTGPGGVTYAFEDATGGWQLASIEDGENVGRFPSLAIDANDQLHAAWINVHTDDESQADVRYATQIGDDWQIETVATLDSVRLGFTGARKLVSLEVDEGRAPSSRLR